MPPNLENMAFDRKRGSVGPNIGSWTAKSQTTETETETLEANSCEQCAAAQLGEQRCKFSRLTVIACKMVTSPSDADTDAAPAAVNVACNGRSLVYLQNSAKGQNMKSAEFTSESWRRTISVRQMCQSSDDSIQIANSVEHLFGYRSRHTLCDILAVTPRQRRCQAKKIFEFINSLRVTSQLILSLFMLLQLLQPIMARHYIAPGPCTWTHVAPNLSRDIRLKSVSPSTSSGLASMVDLITGSTTSSSSSDLDVSLKCSVSALTPFTLNLSQIESEHTVKLDIFCFGGDVNSMDRSTLRSSHDQRNQMPFEHLHSLNSLEINNCKFDRISNETFHGLTSLRNLTITNADYSQEEKFVIEMDSFKPVAAQLLSLNIGWNRFNELPPEFFCPFGNLLSLNLSGNQLSDLHSFGLIDPHTGQLCLHELQVLDLAHNRLESIHEMEGVAALRHLEIVNISWNRITEVAELAFTALRHLKDLDLSHNRLRILPGRMFRNSDALRDLKLSYNQLQELPSTLFVGLSKLLVLDLAGNHITSDSLTTETFADLIRVMVLDLSNNQLRHVPGKVFQNQYSLQVLSLENNHLETIEEGAFASLYNLHTLRLTNNRIRHLPDSVVSGLFVLHSLSLAHNQLEHVYDDAFLNCSNLQILDMSDNRLTTLPLAIQSLEGLRMLNFSNNKLVSLTDPAPFMKAQKIEQLDLSNNYLVNVSRNALRPLASSLQILKLDGNRLRLLDRNTLEDLRPTLRRLRLDRNEFTDVSNSLADVKQLERLEVLNISHNRISWFDYIVIPNQLRLLDISHNQIEQLGNYYELETQLRLEELDASYNQIREITAASIPNSIRTLNLHANRVEKIDQFAFVAKHNVTFVDVRNNSLQRIDNNAFRLGVQRPTSNFFLSRDQNSEFESKYLPPPIFLISGNPFVCDCNMEWLQRVNQLVGGVTGSGAISTYPRIGDLEAVTCQLPFNRQASSLPGQPATLQAKKQLDDKPVSDMVSLLQANSSNFLCRYRTHCFALCHCCEFDACDCEMMCPENCTCYYDQTWNTNIVDCSAANYRSVPLRIPMDVTALYLDGNNLQSINAHTFIGRKNLRILHLNNSNLETIANRSFNGLVYLEELHLEHNKLSVLNGYEFELLQYLSTLHLEHNRIGYIHEKTFASLRNLQMLRLDHNLLTSFGHWFTSSALFGNTAPMLAAAANTGRMLSITLSANPWSCDCVTVTGLYDTLRQVSTQLYIGDAYDVRCFENNQSQTGVFLLRNLKDIENSVLDRCNLSSHALPPSSSFNTDVLRPPAAVSNDKPQAPSAAVTPPNGFMTAKVGNINENEYANNKDTQENRDDSELVSITYHPIDKFVTKTRQDEGMDSASVDETISEMENTSDAQISNQSWWTPLLHPNVITTFVILFCAIILLVLVLTGVRHKQDIQLFFYRRFGVRLFESGLCGCRGRGNVTNRNRRKEYDENTAREGEKLFDAFVIYAKQDENLVTQHLAAELECGFPPYRLCLRYRDLPIPSSSEELNEMTSKDTSFAFDAVTQAIECSRRTLVVISENFLQSEWCKFELKAAHQETLSSCKTHRLLVVVVPSVSFNQRSPQHQSPQHQTQQAKSTEMLLAQMDNECKACVRGVTILTYGERRFWEKLRFAMPPSSSSNPVVSNGTNGSKGRTTTVVVTNGSGYPAVAASTLSSNSSAARHSVMYGDNSQQLYYPNTHHYHYAQLPGSSTTSLHKSSSMSIFASKQPSQHTLQHSNQHLQQQQQQQQHQQHLHQHQQTLSGNSSTLGPTSFRNPFTSKPLPPPPSQPPLPPLPLVSSQFGTMSSHPQQINIGMEINQAPTYATCDELVEYETTGDSLASCSSNPTPNHHLHHSLSASHQMLDTRSRTPRGFGAQQQLMSGQFYHSSRRAPL